ncbi:MAG: bifunctional 4-hydroxy-2-oxoglutarate aldolase/2-dehydro-3-deoxy-phosphogluconate aldolase [Comamonadaceae bacterium]|nr:bifunctional 4-hydroxy-2-oxoglutarate aldolase/2-dehydro-3-deoxy-phosphogluconate aldolase [Rubrivivax sp.]NLZ41756.1 bifunctional 4-hydroxy-2-oxoglutarate aldolase/2-dehydro-3-deoxy-phosphogluconate aldolase [Comamonadaceae bacterium]
MCPAAPRRAPPITATVPIDPLELPEYGPVIPVIVIERLEQAVPLARALVAGGVRVLEVTLRSPVALACIEAIARAVPEAIVGAGTLRSAADLRAAAAAGSRFGVSPGYRPELSQAGRDAALPLLPGVATASEVMAASADGHRLLKFFPAAAAGGVPMLRAFAGPFPDLAFCPTGGIDAGNARQYLALPNVKLCGGSWLTPPDALAAGDWARVTALARAAAALRQAS